MASPLKNIVPLLGIFCFALVLSACTASTATTSAPSDGRVVMTLTDAAANMGTVTSIMMTVENVSVHSTGSGWVLVASPHKTYDLLALKASGSNALLADMNLTPGRYGQVRLGVSRVTVTDENGTHEATLPSGVLRLNGEIVVLANKTSTASFDFIADNSLHMTQSGNYVFAPVIQFESRSDVDVDTTERENVHMSRGTVENKLYAGMDMDGVMDVNGKLPRFIDIQENGKVTGSDYDSGENSSQRMARHMR